MFPGPRVLPGPGERGEYVRRGSVFSSQTPFQPFPLPRTINTGGKERGVPALLRGQDE